LKHQSIAALSHRKIKMPRTIRSLIGTVGMVIFVILYAIIVMLFSTRLMISASEVLHPYVFRFVQVLYYALAGIGWAFPIMPLIKWMNKPDV
jgi:hypothetical protein